jgi:YD repeat-containing protein
MPGDNPAVEKTVQDIDSGMKARDLTTVFDDIRTAQTNGGDFEKFKADLNREMHAKGVLPGLDIVGMQDNKLLLKNTQSGQLRLVDQGMQLSDVKPAPNGEQRATADKPADTATSTNGDRVTLQGGVRAGDATTVRTGDTTTLRASDGTVRRTEGDATTDTARQRTEPSNVERDKDGRPTKVEYAPGKTREFTYDKEGKPSEIKDSSGAVFTTKDGGKSWNMHDASGDHAVSRLVVDRRGSVAYEDATTHGTTVLRHDGSTVEANDKGQVTHIKTATGKDLARKKQRWRLDQHRRARIYAQPERR